MDFRKTNLIELHKKIINNEISISELANDVIDNHNKHKKSNFLVTMDKNQIFDDIKNIDKNIDNSNILYGIPYDIKDNICTKNLLTTGCSKILKNFQPQYNATVIDTLDKLGALKISKVALDELGLGGTGLLSCFGEIKNPLDQNRIIGGSSSGSAYAVATGIIPFALGTDTGDSIRKPASYVGIYGFKPTYGAISRYGVISYAPSLDHVGFFTNSIDDCAILCDALFQYDKNDFTSIDNKNEYYKKITDTKKIKFSYLDYWYDKIDNKQKKYYSQLFSELKNDGHSIECVSIDFELLDSLFALYMAISFSEVSSTQANLDGIKFGIRENGENYEEVVKNSRTKNLGDVVKQRYVIGRYILNRENQIELLDNAKKIRRKIINQINKIYEKNDVLILPSSVNVAPLIRDANLQNADDFNSSNEKCLENLLLLANFTGMPSLTIPFIKNKKLPIGLNINCAYKNDLTTLQAGKIIENILKEKMQDVDYE